MPVDHSNPDAHEIAPQTSGRNRPAPLVLGILLGLGALLLGTLGYLYLTNTPLPRLTRDAYEAAAERWDTHGPANYNLDIELSGSRPSLIHVEVRNGEVVHMTRDGIEPRQQRTWYYWSVPGQMDTIADELDMAENPAESFNAPGATQMVQWAEFDPKYGYPIRYDRVVLGTEFEVHWRTTRFQPLDSELPTER